MGLYFQLMGFQLRKLCLYKGSNLFVLVPTAALRSGTETPLFAEYVNFFHVSSVHPQVWTVKESYK